MSWALIPERLLEKVASVPIESVRLTERSGCRLIDFLVPVDPECAPDRAWNICVNWDSEIRVGRIAGVGKYERFCDVDAEWIHYRC